MDVAVVLEEIQMPPLFLLEIVGLAEGAADGTGIFRAPLALDGQMQLVGLFAGIQLLIHQLPRGFETQAKEQDLVVVHAAFLTANSKGISW